MGKTTPWLRTATSGTSLMAPPNHAQKVPVRGPAPCVVPHRVALQSGVVKFVEVPTKFGFARVTGSVASNPPSTKMFPGMHAAATSGSSTTGASWPRAGARPTVGARSAAARANRASEPVRISMCRILSALVRAS